MGRYVFKLPDVGEGIAEAEIVAWHVAPGDMVEEDQPLADVMTDKATVELTSPVAGRVVALGGEVGKAAAIGSDLVILEVEGAGEAQPAAAPAPPAPAAAVPDKAPSPPPTTPASESAPPRPAARATLAQPSGSAPLASPFVRRRAVELDLRLEEIAGTGPAGRILSSDLDAHLSSPRPARGSARRTAVETVKVIGLRRKIAERMSESKRRIPHFSYIEEVDVTELERLRGELNRLHPDRPRLTVLPFITHALVLALPHFPQINAIYDDVAGEVHRHAGVHLGVAAQTPTGLVVPVVRHAETLDLWATAAEIARLAEAAKSGKATREELSGSTITVTSLGPLGGVSTTPVINHPEVAIVGPNKIVERPVVVAGAIVVRKMMNLSSSFDHRVVDGWDAAEFVQRLKRLLETPALLFLEP